ncbi:MAG TPA: DUF559 domain-containing protein [Propionicimonas sp.]|nr:DUF559 domain-containing protein [Propionicimonas sp.]
MDTIETLLTREGFVLAREHPLLARTLNRRWRAGQLERLHPGVFADPQRLSVALRLRALCRWAPRAVLHEATAISLWLGEEPRQPLQLANPCSLRAPVTVHVTQRRIAAEHIHRERGLTLASPAYAAAERAASDDGQAAMHLLRTGMVSIDTLTEAATALRGTRGHAKRMRVLRSLAANPWSPAERRLHALLGGVSGWVANHRLRLDGITVIPDVLFEASRLVVEVDGYQVHGGSAAFQRDRDRQNLLVRHGYAVLRLTWQDLTERPEHCVRLIRHTDRVWNLHADALGDVE